MATRPIHRLARVPFVPLADLPTPVDRLHALSRRWGCEVWAKRDDKSHAEIGGNKVRKMEFLLPELEATGRPILAYGPWGSNWLRVLLWCADRRGLDVRAFAFPQCENDASRASRRVISALGRTRIAPDVTSFVGGLLLEAPRLVGDRVLLAPMGGTNVASSLGYVNAVLELAEQAPRPDVMYVAHGTGGTAAGIYAGAAILGWEIEIVAVRITSGIIANARRLVAHAREILVRLGIAWPRTPPRLRCVPDFHTRYGETTPESRDARLLWAATEGIALDDCYTAKAAAALGRDAREGRLRGRTALFWHTWARARALDTPANRPMM